MPDDTDPKDSNVVSLNSALNDPSGSRRSAASSESGQSSSDTEPAKRLRRALRKLKREQSSVPTIEQLSKESRIAVPQLRELMKASIELDDGSGFNAMLASVLEQKAQPAQAEQAYTPPNERFKAGQTLACKVMKKEHGGYLVIIKKFLLNGFLPTDGRMEIGSEILAQYVCIHDGRILLSTRTVAGPSGSVTELAQRKIVNAKPHRATDIFLPPLDKTKEPFTLDMDKSDLDWLIKDIECASRTGCLQTSSSANRSRSSSLLYRGRVVGSIYSNKKLRSMPDTQMAVQMILDDLEAYKSHVVMYALPEEIVLAMSSLFLGDIEDFAGDKTGVERMEHILNTLAETSRTACLSLNFSSPKAESILTFIYGGQCAGSFVVGSQEFFNGIQFVLDTIQEHPEMKIEVSTLPAEIESLTLGYTFSAVLKEKR